VTGDLPDSTPALRRRGFGAYGAIVSALGAVLVCALFVAGEPLPLGDWRFWLMAALVLVGELMPIDVPRRDGADRVAISTAFAFAMLLEFGLLPAVLAYAAASVWSPRLQLAAAAFRLSRRWDKLSYRRRSKRSQTSCLCSPITSVMACHPVTTAASSTHPRRALTSSPPRACG